MKNVIWKRLATALWYVPFVVVVFAAGAAWAQSAFITSVSDHKVTVLDTVRSKVVGGFSLSGTITGVAVGKAGRRIFVVSGENQRRNTIIVVEPSGRIVATIPIDGTPGVIAASPDRSRIYVAADHILNVIDATKAVLERHVLLEMSPKSVAVSPDGKAIAIGDAASGGALLLDSATLKVTAKIAAAATPGGVVWSSTGTKLFLADQEASAVDVIDVVHRRVVARIPVGQGPYGVAITANGKKLYVANSGLAYGGDASRVGGTISVIDVPQFKAVTTIPVGQQPHGVAITPDGTMVYVVNASSNSVTLISTHSDKAVTTLTVGRNPFVSGDFIGPSQSR